MEDRQPPDTSKELATATVWDNWSFGLGIACVFLGGMIGILPMITIVISAIAQSKPPKPRPGGWKSIIGLVAGALYFLVYLNNYGHLR